MGLIGVTPDMLLWLDWLKGEPDRSFMDHLNKNDVKKIKKIKPAQFLIMFDKNQHLIVAKNVTMSAVILCPADCVGDIIIKASTCGKGINYVMSQPFSALHW